MTSNKLRISTEEFFKNLSNLIASGVTFEAEEQDGIVTITFTGGY
jgi:hypothetical protein